MTGKIRTAAPGGQGMHLRREIRHGNWCGRGGRKFTVGKRHVGSIRSKKKKKKINNTHKSRKKRGRGNYSRGPSRVAVKVEKRDSWGNGGNLGDLGYGVKTQRYDKLMHGHWERVRDRGEKKKRERTKKKVLLGLKMNV